jgi:hypothetical protein
MREQGVRKPMERLTLRIPAGLAQQARRQAGAARRSLNRYIIEAVEHRVSESEQLLENAIAIRDPGEAVVAALKERGFLIQPDSSWDGLLSGRPLKTHVEILEMMSGQRPLSEDVIEMRGEL